MTNNSFWLTLKTPQKPWLIGYETNIRDRSVGVFDIRDGINLEI